MTHTPWYCDRRRRRRGLTLLEVIVAMTVLSIGIAGALGAISACMRSTDASTGYSHGALLAQQVAAELERSETLEEGELEGKFDDMATAYSWEATISAADDQGLYPAQITVYWGGASKRSYELYTVLHPHTVPTAASATDAAPEATEDVSTPGTGGGQTISPGSTPGTGGGQITTPGTTTGGSQR